MLRPERENSFREESNFEGHASARDIPQVRFLREILVANP